MSANEQQTVNEPSKRKRARRSSTPGEGGYDGVTQLDNIANRMCALSSQFCSVVYASFMVDQPLDLNPYRRLFENISRDLERLEPLSSTPYPPSPETEDLSAINDRLAKAVLLLEKRLSQLPSEDDLPDTQLVSSDSDAELCQSLMKPFDREIIPDSDEDDIC